MFLATPQKMIKDLLIGIEINNGGNMNSLVINGNTVNLRNDGRLEDIEDWTPVLAEQMAKNEGLSLTDEHWDVINTMREYYKAYNLSPILKLLRKELSKKYGAERASVATLDALFSNGVQHQGSRLAGLPLAHLDAELDQATRVQSVNFPVNEAGHFKDQFDFNGKSIKVYASGNLVHLEDWSEELACVLAQKEDIELSSDHWIVVNFLRKFYFQYGVAPMVKILIKQMSEELGSEIANKKAMYQLFPAGPAKQGSRIAGLPSPQGCIDD